MSHSHRLRSNADERTRPSIPRGPCRQPAAARRNSRREIATSGGEISAAELRRVEDAAIAQSVARLEETGMQSITDGEFRRAWFHLDFLEQLDGVAVTGNIAASSDAADTVHMTPPRLAVAGKLGHTHDIRVADYAYLASLTQRTPQSIDPFADHGALPWRPGRNRHRGLPRS